MKRNKVLSFLCATVSLFLALCSLASCVDRPSPEVVTEWEGKENFEPSDNANPELKARYEKCADRCGSAFDGAVPESGELFGVEAYEDGVKLISYSGDSATVVVPDTVGGKSVLALGAEVFAGKPVTSVSLPDSIKHIEKGAFAKCEALFVLRLPFVGDGAEITHFGHIFGADGYEQHAVKVPGCLDVVIISGDIGRIESNAFAGCKGISAVCLPETVTEIGEFAFYECRDLVYLYSASDKLNLEQYAFGYCSELYSFTVPSADSVGFGAFYECDSIEELNLPFVGGSCDENNYLGYIFGAGSADYNGEFVPQSLRSVSILQDHPVGDRAFAGCTDIKDIRIADGVEKIGIRAFYSCRSLASVEIPDSVREICDDAFFGCDSLKSIELPSTLEKLGIQVFMGCRSLESVDVPDKLLEIPSSTFAFCTSLKSVKLNNVKKVGKDAFFACDALEKLNVDGIEIGEGNGALTGEEESEEQ